MSRWLPALVLMVIVAGCGDPEASATHWQRRAVELREAGQFDEARQALELALRQAPDDWQLHRDLAVLAADHLEDLPLAIIHYRAAITAAPDTARPELERQLEHAEHTYYRQLRARFTPPPAPPREPLPEPIVDEAPPAPEPPRTWVVRDGDTLAKIAREVYGSASAWDRIYNANRDRLPSPDRLRVGQELRLPGEE